MRTSVIVRPPNSFVQLLDPKIGEGPDEIGEEGYALVTATESCVFVTTLADSDGPTEITLDDGDFDAPADLEVSWSGVIQTVEQLAVMTVEWETLLAVPTSGPAAVTIRANRADEPDRLYIHVSEAGT